MKSRPEAASLARLIEAMVETFEPGAEVLPGITAILLRGHTPGQVGYQIVSGREKLFDVGDVVHSEAISLKRPEWTVKYDSDPQAARETREKTLRELARTKVIIFSPHLPFPGFGRMVASKVGYDWMPVHPAETGGYSKQ